MRQDAFNLARDIGMLDEAIDRLAGENKRLGESRDELLVENGRLQERLSLQAARDERVQENLDRLRAAVTSYIDAQTTVDGLHPDDWKSEQGVADISKRVECYAKLKAEVFAK